MFFSAISQQTASYTISVKGACGMCSDRIETTAKTVQGVQTAQYNLDEQSLIVEVIDDKFSIFDLHFQIASSGHDTNKEKAPLEAYEALPGCCQYKEVAIHEYQEEHNIPHKHSHTETPEIAQDRIIGVVYEKDESNELIPLIGANLTWLETGSGTSTDVDGKFDIQIPADATNLIVSYVGYTNDTLSIEYGGNVDIVLDPSVMLQAVNITYRKKATEVSRVSSLKIQNISSEELTKAACCTLSESFETTASVDIGFADAITGLRTIQMLGLAGPYVQITNSALPDVRGISALYGMEYTPGPWIQSIQLNQGVGSVVQGFEGIAGQINVETFKPYSKEKLYINGYANQGRRYEGNLLYNTDVSKNVATSIAAHVSQRKNAMDHNHDSFADMPLADQKVISNKWSFDVTDNWNGSAGVKLTQHNHRTGQVEIDDEHGHHHHAQPENPWLSRVDIDRQEVWLKTGYNFNEQKSSIATQISYSQHDHNSEFGNRAYVAEQNTIFANALYKHITQDDGDYLIAGLSYIRDDISENLERRAVTDDYQFDFVESVPGIWAEYNMLHQEKFTLVAGIRADHHNNYGWFTTPRLHMRYAPKESTVIRAVAGRGQKTAKVIAENIGMLASNRNIIIRSENNENPYGLQPEVAWNFGLNLVQDITLGNTEISLQLDGYYTTFENQIVVDYFNTANAVSFYNLDGKSNSLSLQALASIQPHKSLEIRVAHRYNQVKTQYLDGFLNKPLIAPHRTFVNVGYAHDSGWKLDYTVNRIGQKYLGTTNESSFSTIQQSPSFYMHNAQISKVWDKTFEIYLGVENIFHFRQDNAILHADDTTHPFFDASQVWGPIFGRNLYIGFRHKLFNDEARGKKGCG